MKFIKNLPTTHAQQALYLKDDQYVLVSTLTHEQKMSNLMELFGVDPHPSFGEETTAFPADENGNMLSGMEIAKSFGDGSRERVLAQLSDT